MEASCRRPSVDVAAAPPSLASLCVRVVARHLDFVEDLGPCVTPPQYAALLAATRAPPETVARLERPDLATADSDEAYFRCAHI